MKTLYHNSPINSSGANQDVELYSSYEGIVRRRTPSGCIVELQLENGKSAMSYVFGGWSVGSQVLVYITKLFEDRFPRGVCESVLQYAEDVA